jgi:hypothetical protein
MKKLTKVVFGLVGFALLAVAFAPLTERHAIASGSAPVSVTNVPLPVQGTVSVGNTPSVHVTNTPVVTVGNSPSVNVSNSSLPVTNPLDSFSNPVPLLVSTDAQPYESSCGIFTAQDFNQSCSFDAVPTGKRLVIREFSAVTFTSPGTSVHQLFLQVGWKGGLLQHYFPLFSLGSDAFNTTAAVHTETTIYAESSSSPTCVVVDTAQNSWEANCSITGYLIPAP